MQLSPSRFICFSTNSDLHRTVGLHVYVIYGLFILFVSSTQIKSCSISHICMSMFQGVVILEEIYRQKAIIKVPDQSAANLLAALAKLDEKIPSRDILQKTKIGKINYTILVCNKSKWVQVHLPCMYYNAL